MSKFFYWALCLVMLFSGASAQHYELIPLATNVKISMRGLAVVNKNIIWVSGNKGHVGKSLDGGKTWQWMQPKGYETLDFRDIQAFDSRRAIIVNAGSPAYILSTIDGGKTWQENYSNTDTAIFLDGMDFWDEQHGLAFGDPINHKMQLLRTNNGGKTWEDISALLRFPLKNGEAGFAASGTTIKTLENGKVWIATGGAVANIYFSSNYGESWKVYSCPILQGENSTGVFSIDFFDAKNGIAVGGNYLKVTESSNNALYTKNGGKTWSKPQSKVGGYRSGVTYVTNKICVATGTSGTDVSVDGGKNWKSISTLGFNAVKAADGTIILVGANGQIYELQNKI